MKCPQDMTKTKRDIFQAIADPTRRAILSLLAFQAMTPGILAKEFDISRQAVSKHIRILKECELIRQEKKGREIHYQLEWKKMQEIDQWVAPFRQLWENRFHKLDKLLTEIPQIYESHG